MADIPIPQLTSEMLERSARSIIGYDQWDDWVPDAVYFRDAAQNLPAYVQSLTGVRSLTAIQPYRFDVHSLGRVKFSTSAVSLNTRVITTSVIAMAASALRDRINPSRVKGFQYRQSSARARQEWIGDIFSGGSDSPVPRTTKPHSPLVGVSPIFGAVGEGAFEAFEAVGTWLTSAGGRTVLWRDVKNFYATIKRPRLWAALQDAGIPESTTRFLEAVTIATGPGASGLIPIDDAWNFLASYYLRTADADLDAAGVLWQRCGDEYFLQTDHENAPKASAALTAALKRLGLEANPDKNHQLSVDGGHGLDAVQFEGFRLVVSQSSTSSDLYYEQSLLEWPALLSAALGSNDAPVSHSAVALLLRCVNFARERDALNLYRGGKPSSAKATKYVTSLRTQRVGPALEAQLQTAWSKRDAWRCYWLLGLIGDVTEQPSAAALALARDERIDPVLCSQAVLTLARIGEAPDVLPLIDRLRGSPSPIVKRNLLTALHLADKRWQRNLLQREPADIEPMLLDYLKRQRT